MDGCVNRCTRNFGVGLFICDSIFVSQREGMGRGWGGRSHPVFFCSYRAVVMVLMMGRHASNCPVISFLSH